jgi:predicted transcriptional regulator
MGTKLNELTQKLDAQNIRDEKIFNLTLLGWSKSRIAEELKISRTTVTMVISSPFGQARLAEMYESIEQPLMMLPELVGLSLNQLKNQECT